VVRRGDQDGVDVLAVEQVAVVPVALRLADLLGPAEPALVDVADGDDGEVVLVAALDERAQVPGAHAAAADDAEAQLFAGIRGALFRRLRRAAPGIRPSARPPRGRPPGKSPAAMVRSCS